MITFKKYIQLKEQSPATTNQPNQVQQKPGQPNQPNQVQQKPGQPNQVQQKPGQPNQVQQKPGQPNQQVDIKKLTDTFAQLKQLLGPLGIK